MKIIQRLPGLGVLKSTKACGISLHQSRAAGPDFFFLERQMFISTLVPLKQVIYISGERKNNERWRQDVPLPKEGYRRIVKERAWLGHDFRAALETAGPEECFWSHYVAGQRREINVHDKT